MAVIDLLRKGAETYCRPNNARHRFQLTRHNAYMLEMDSIRFNLDSAVTLPDKMPTSGHVQNHPNSLGGLVIAANAIQQAQEEPQRLMLVVGHTDQIGTAGHNLKLSAARSANVNALITNDRRAWVDSARLFHRVIDYQTILRWVVRNLDWPCDPVKIDDNLGPLTRQALMRFQASYNRVFGRQIEEDGRIGEQTFGAMFDVYRQEMAVLLEISQEKLDARSSEIKLVQDPVGCGPHHPRDEVDHSYVSPSDRRAEILFFEPKDRPPLDCHTGVCDPTACRLYRKPVYRFHQLEAKPLSAPTWMKLQTVDELGHKQGNIDLIISSQLGPEIEVTTDDDGYYRDRIRLFGTVEIKRTDGGELLLGSAEPDNHSRTVVTLSGDRDLTSIVDLIVVGVVDAETLKAHEEQKRRYATASRSSVRGSADPTGTEQPDTASARTGDEQTETTSSSVHDSAIDNLILLSLNDDWSVDYDKLRRELHAWLKDYHPAVKSGYTLNMPYGNELQVFDQSQSRVGRFEFTEEVAFASAYGGYLTLAAPEGVPLDIVFADMVQETRALITTVNGEVADDYLAIESLVDNSDDLVQLNASEAALGKGLVFYHAPAPSDADAAIALAFYGGNGLLEPYPSDGGLNARVHKRNVRLINVVTKTFRAYLRSYIESVDECKNEVQLHKLGPPRKCFQFPMPAGVSKEQRREIQQAQGESSYPAWKAITAQLNKFWGRRSDGALFIKVEFEVNSGELGGPFSKAVFKFNFEADTDGRIKTGDEKRVAVNLKAPDKFAKEKGAGGGVDYIIDPETGEVVQKVSISGSEDSRLGPYGFEVASNGSVKASYGAYSAEYNYKSQEVIVGAEVSLKDLVAKGWSKRNGDVPDWVKKLPDVKAGIGIGFQGLRPSTVLNVVSRAPGFFEMRTLTEFQMVDWNTLRWDEANALEELGWNQYLWDHRRSLPLSKFPKSARTDYYDLKPVQKYTLTRIPLRAWAGDPEWRAAWRKQAASG